MIKIPNCVNCIHAQVCSKKEDLQNLISMIDPFVDEEATEDTNSPAVAAEKFGFGLSLTCPNYFEGFNGMWRQKPLDIDC